MCHINKEHEASCSLYFNLYCFLKAGGVEFERMREGMRESATAPQHAPTSLFCKKRVSTNPFENLDLPSVHLQNDNLSYSLSSSHSSLHPSSTQQTLNALP